MDLTFYYKTVVLTKHVKFQMTNPRTVFYCVKACQEPISLLTGFPEFSVVFVIEVKQKIEIYIIRHS